MYFTINILPDDDNQEIVVERYEVPIYFEYGNRCILPGRRSTPLKEVIPALSLDRDTDENMSS